MPDVFNQEKRAAVMRRVKDKNTAPELAVRRILHGLGFRFRLHRADLPGKPDIVMPKYKMAVFVHGCFWHQHNCARGNRVPADNRDYWMAKLSRNVDRDRKNQGALADLGWRVLLIWECEMKDKASLGERLQAELVQGEAE